MGTRLKKRQNVFLILIGQLLTRGLRGTMICRRLPQTVPDIRSIKIFLCRRGRIGRESRIKFYSPDHTDRWSPTTADAVSNVPI